MNPQRSGAPRSADEERNLKAVLDFYDIVIKQGHFQRAGEWLDPGYRQHKPVVRDGPEGVLEFVRGEHKRVPGHVVEVVRAFVDGDYVFLHVHVHLQPHEADRAVMDIFRCRNGRLLEHWDVDEPVPPPEKFVHPNGMF